MSRLLATSGLALLTACSTYTPAFEDGAGRPLPDSLALLEKIEIGGIEQWIIVRGADRTRPLLLFLHGGPGSPTAPLVRKFAPELEEMFVVVHWEQRGAGKSFSTPRDALNVEQMVDDTAELSRLLLRRFGREKLFVLGHSWGTFLGVRAVQAHPELFHAYIGVGQIVHRAEQERLSYEHVLAVARSRGDADAIEVLEDIGPPPWPEEEWVGRLSKERGFVRRYGGTVHDPAVYERVMRGRHLLLQEEYTFRDKLNWVRGQIVSERALAPEMLCANFLEDAARLEVPVILVQGRHDWHTPAVLVEQWHDLLDAPHKELHLLDHSAHVVIGEEPERFARILRERVLPWGPTVAGSAAPGSSGR
jgi:pimeloyl-ACP methyl ester carboxylesterase